MNNDLISVTVQVYLSDLPTLYKYNPKLSLQENIRKIIEKYNDEERRNQMLAMKIDRKLLLLDETLRFDLKLIPDSKNISITEHYITDENVSVDIQNGRSLKLVRCLRDLVNQMFETKIDGKLLLELSNDEAFRNIIVETNHHDELMELIRFGPLNSDGEGGALNVVYHLFKNGYIRSFHDNFVEKVVDIVKKLNESSSFALPIVIQILVSKKEVLASNKEIVLKNLGVPYIMKMLSISEMKVFADMDMFFHQKAVRAINSLISCSAKEQRAGILLELNSAPNRTIFYKFLCFFPKIDDYIAHEIFILQARLLTSTYLEYYANRASFISEYDLKRQSFASNDFDYIRPARSSEEEPDAEWLSNMQRTESLFSIVSETSLSQSPTSSLLQRCLHYGKMNYHTYFESLEKSDYSCDAELYTIAQNIISLLTSLLCIGVKVHNHNYYLPLYFAPAEVMTANGEVRSVDFFEELFVKTLMLLFQTKAEMRVKTKEDFKKLYQVVSKQLKILFEKHPKDFMEWDIEARHVTYTLVQEILQDEREKKWKYLYEHNKCLKDLAAEFTRMNNEVIKYQRYKVLQDGYKFPNMRRAKNEKNTHFMLTLLPDFAKFMYCDYKEDGELIGGAKFFIHVKEIRHIVVDVNCYLIRDGLLSPAYKDYVFSILHGEEDCGKIDCYMDNAETAALWKDGISLLLGKQLDNERYHKELDMLNEVDCAMQLIELQDVEIPVEAPIVPKFSY